MTCGSDLTHPAISYDHGHALCRMPSHPIWTQLLALMSFGQLRILHPSGHMYLLSALTVSKTPTDWKKGMPVLTCLAGRVSEGPVPVLFKVRAFAGSVYLPMSLISTQPLWRPNSTNLLQTAF